MSWVWDVTGAPMSRGAAGMSARATSGWRICLLLVASVGCLGEVSTPLIGYVRDLKGVLRPVHGVAGAFVTGAPVERDVVSAAWSGSAGFAKTASELLVLGRHGVAERIAAPEGPAAFGFLPDGSHGWVRYADGSCRKFGDECPSLPESRPALRCRLPERVAAFEALGDGWLLARAQDKLYAIRMGKGSDEIYELPEGEP